MNTLIVVLNWNSREMTRDCLQSLLAMEGNSFQILLIDNGSQDGSVEFLQEAFPNIQVVANGRNLGFAAGCNIGMDRALKEGHEYVPSSTTTLSSIPSCWPSCEARRHAAPLPDWYRPRSITSSPLTGSGGRVEPTTYGLAFLRILDEKKLTLLNLMKAEI